MDKRLEKDIIHSILFVIVEVLFLIPYIINKNLCSLVLPIILIYLGCVNLYCSIRASIYYRNKGSF